MKTPHDENTLLIPTVQDHVTAQHTLAFKLHSNYIIKKKCLESHKQKSTASSYSQVCIDSAGNSRYENCLPEEKNILDRVTG